MEIKYDRIGIHYNATRKADPYLTERLYQYLKPKKGALYLDIGCGTGNYTIALNNEGVNIAGIDPSYKMLTEARRKHPDIEWINGTAESTKLKDESIAGILAFLTIHHWTDLQKGFLELHRILKNKGQLVLFTSTSEQMEGYWLNHYFPLMLEKSKNQMPSGRLISESLETAGFKLMSTEKYDIHPELTDHFLYCGKHKPSLYLDPAIRNGISSFSDLANEAEINHGLRALEEDIKTGKINSIKNKYQNDGGDYLFITCEKENKPAVMP